jgi:hypothetical protein
MKKMKYRSSITFADFLLSVQFAKDVVNSNLDQYESRNQKNKFKVFDDILKGKICEYVVYYCLDECNEPDLRIYPKNKKSFDSDLKAKGFNIHVKSCSKESIFPLSWVFQPNDKLTKEPGKRDLLALCIIDKEFNVEFELMKATEVIDKYKPPKKANLNKLVLYKEDLFNEKTHDQRQRSKQIKLL